MKFPSQRYGSGWADAGAMGRELPPGGPVAGMSSALERWGQRWAQRAELGRLDDDQCGEAAEEDVSPRAEHE
jgi:hypothetical protein